MELPADQAPAAGPVRRSHMAADRRRARDGVCRCRQVEDVGPTALRRENTHIMADTKKLSVEKALNKIRADEAPKSRSEKQDEEMDVLDEEIKRMRAQRLRLERHQRKRD